MLYAALEAGVTRLFRIGGAQAIAALAYGTETVPRVDKIVGPGNAYVAAAKSLVSRDCAIDFFAGPSEIACVSATGKPAWIAADLLAQAEHDPDARAILITTSRRLAQAVAREVSTQLPCDGPARQALAAHGGVIVTRTLGEAIDLMQRLAPEHAVVRFASGRGAADESGHGVRRRITARRPPATTSRAPITCCRPAAPPRHAVVSARQTSCACPRCRR